MGAVRTNREAAAVTDVEFLPADEGASPAESDDDLSLGDGGGGLPGWRLPRWAAPAALSAVAALAGGAVLLSGGHPAPLPAPTPSPTLPIGPMHMTDPSLHHWLPGGGYLY